MNTNKNNGLRFWFFVGALVFLVSLLSRSNIKSVPAWVTQKPSADKIYSAYNTALILDAQVARGGQVPSGFGFNKNPQKNTYSIPEITVSSPGVKFWQYVFLYESDSSKANCLYVLRRGITVKISYDEDTYVWPFSNYSHNNETPPVMPIVWYDEESDCLRGCKGKKIPEDVKIVIRLEEIDKGILYKDRQTTL